MWPDGVVGSITHCEGYRAAAAAHAVRVAALGIDAEPDQPLPRGVLMIVSSSAERERLRWLPPAVCWDRLLFSAKESIYKAWFPLTGRYLDFAEVDLVIRCDSTPRAASIGTCGTFSGRLLVPGPALQGRRLTAFDGTWMAAHGRVLTAVVVQPAAVAGRRRAGEAG